MNKKERIIDMLKTLRAVEELEYYDKCFLHTTASVHKMKLEYYDEILRILKKFKQVNNINGELFVEADQVTLQEE